MPKIIVSAAIGLLLCGCAGSAELTRPIESNQKIATPSSDKLAALKTELDARFDNDKKFRDDFILDLAKPANRTRIREIAENMRVYDGANEARLDELMKEYDWRSLAALGNKATAWAFYVVQHAPQGYKKRYLPLLKNAAEQGTLEKSLFVYLDDRVRMGDGRPQLYGTQAQRASTGKLFTWPIEDEANVDARRAEFGWPTIVAHAKTNKYEYIPFAERVATSKAKLLKVTPPAVLQVEANSATHSALKVELEAMFETDQKIRQLFVKETDKTARAALLEKMLATDKANELRLGEIVQQHG
jgi:hypothetical protein